MIAYRKMTAADISQVARLEAQCFSHPWSERSVASELTNPLSLWLVASKGDTVIGYIGSQSVLGEADMMNVAVCEQYRNQGIARMLITELIDALKDNNVHCLTLEVRASNEPAIHLYHALGFVQVGRRPNYYAAPREDALILKKEWDCEDSGN